MNPKHYELLNLFLTPSGRTFTYAALAEQMNVSVRSVRNYIAGVNDFLRENDLPLISVTHDRKLYLPVTEETRQKILTILRNLGRYEYSLSQKERITAVYLLMISSPQITASQIADELGTSKKTCANDMKGVMQEFEKNGISFVSTGRGYRTEISEYFRRDLIVHTLCNRLDITGTNASQSGLYTWVVQYFRLDALPAAQSVVTAWLHEHLLELDGLSYTKFTVSLLVAMSRIRQGFPVQPNSHWMQTASAECAYLADDLTQRLSGITGVFFTDAEVRYAADLINRIIWGEQEKKYWRGVDVQMIVRVFLTGVSQSIGLDLTNDALLQKQLVSHIDSTLGRLINGDLPTYHFKDELIERNQAVFDALKQNISILEKSLHCKFNEDTLSYIMMHVIASIERTYIANPVRACIVCNAGVASGVYLAERLRNYCKLDIIATIPGHKLQMLLESSVEKPDLIISVIPLPPQSIPVITIPPLPTEKVLTAVQNAVNSVLQKRRNCIFAPMDSGAELPAFLPEPKYSFREIFQPDMVLPECRAATWSEAIQAAGDLLIRAGYADEHYVREIIRNVTVNGPYFVLFPGIALAHAVAPDLDSDFHASIVRLTSPVSFHHEKNDPVYYVIAFISSDHERNHEKIFSLISLFSNARRLQSFINAETPEEFLELLGMA